MHVQYAHNVQMHSYMSLLHGLVVHARARGSDVASVRGDKLTQFVQTDKPSLISARNASRRSVTVGTDAAPAHKNAGRASRLQSVLLLLLTAGILEKLYL